MYGLYYNHISNHSPIDELSDDDLVPDLNLRVSQVSDNKNTPHTSSGSTVTTIPAD